MRAKSICIITAPSTRGSGIPILLNFIKVLSPICEQLFVITSEHFSYEPQPQQNIHIFRLKMHNQRSAFRKMILGGIAQIEIALRLTSSCNHVDIVIFFIGANTYVFPMLIAKALDKKTLVIATGAVDKISRMDLNAPGLFSNLNDLLVKVNFTITDYIIVYTESLVSQFHLEMFSKKILIAERHFIDTSLFKIINPFENREKKIGYIGHISNVKGVMNFAQAISLLAKMDEELKFLFVGDGELLAKLKDYLREVDCLSRVELTGWIFNQEIPKLMNELKLLVIPSYTESGPSTDLEAMACGTPVLATKVGHIPDVIVDGKNGFILEDNSPECIANNVLRALNYPNLDDLIENSLYLIKNEYTYEAVKARYRDILRIVFDE